VRCNPSDKLEIFRCSITVFKYDKTCSIEMLVFLDVLGGKLISELALSIHAFWDVRQSRFAVTCVGKDTSFD